MPMSRVFIIKLLRHYILRIPFKVPASKPVTNYIARALIGFEPAPGPFESQSLLDSPLLPDILDDGISNASPNISLAC